MSLLAVFKNSSCWWNGGSKKKKKQRDTRSVFTSNTRSSEDGSFPKKMSDSAGAPHDLFTGFSSNTPVTRTSTATTTNNSTVADSSVWSSRSAPSPEKKPPVKKKSLRNLFSRRSSCSSKWNKLENEQEVKPQQVPDIHPPPKQSSSPSCPVDLDDFVPSTACPVDLDESVTTSDDISIQRERQQQDDEQFLQRQEQHLAELDAIVKNFEEGKLYHDDSTTEDGHHHGEEQVHFHENTQRIDTTNLQVSPLERPPRTPRKTSEEECPQPPQPQQGQTQRFRLSPSFKEIVCKFKTPTGIRPKQNTHNNVDASPYSQSSYLSEVSSLSGFNDGRHDNMGLTFQHTAWSPSNVLAPKTSYPSAAFQGQRQRSTAAPYQPFQFLLTDNGSEDKRDNTVINPSNQLSTQMMAMGQEILCKLIGNEDRSSAVKSPPRKAQCLILLMDPRHRIFEVIPAFSNFGEVLTAQDVLSQIPYQATDYRLKYQEYIGFCCSDTTTGHSYQLVSTDDVPRGLLEISHADPLFAVPRLYSAEQIEMFGAKLLKHPKVIRMIHDHQVLLGMKTS